MRVTAVRSLIGWCRCALVPIYVALNLESDGAGAASYSAIVVDAASGEMLHAVEPHQRWYPASLTKMMTLYVTFGELVAGRLMLEDVLAVSAHAASQPATELGLGTADTITVQQAILAVILRSANDAAVALGERIGGTEAAFAATMTNKARGLGMTRTIFRNASGLPDPEQVTTARDMAILGRALVRDYPEFYRNFAEVNFEYGGRTFSTINGILSHYPGADGIKTGFTCGSGYNLAASAVRGGHRLIAVLMGAKNRADRSDEIVRLLDAGFATLNRPDRPQRLFANMTVAPSTDAVDPPPPFQLSESECAIGASPTTTASTIARSGGRLPGWGVILGIYFSQTAARAAIGRARSQLKAISAGGEATLIPRRWQGVRSYAALLVALEEHEASAACKRLRGKGLYCQTLSPTLLNSPTAVWR